MNLSRFTKRVVSIISALALVIAGIVYAPSTAKAANPETLTYTTATCNGGADVLYSVTESSIEGWGNPWYGDGGVTFQLIFSGDNTAADTTVKVNGTETTSGIVAAVFNGGIKLNPTLMADNAYTEVVVTAKTGNATIYFKKGNPSGGSVATTTQAGGNNDETENDGDIITHPWAGEFTETQTTTAAATTTKAATTTAAQTTTAAATTTAAQTTTKVETTKVWVTTAAATTTKVETTAEQTTKAPNYEDMTWVPIAATNEYFYNENHTVHEIVSVQTPPWAQGNEGIYFNVTAGINEIKINGSTEGSIIDGAGALLCLSALTETYNEVEVTYGGSQKASLIIKYVPEVTTKKATTTAAQTTTKAATTKAATTTADVATSESSTGEKLDTPLGFADVSTAEQPYSFSWNAVEGADGYIISVNEENFKTVTGTNVQLDSSIFSHAGEYKIDLVAYKGDIKSGKTTIYVTVNEETTKAATDYESMTWIPVAATNKYFYNENNTVNEVVSVQTPPWADGNEGIYFNVTAGINEIKINGSTEGSIIDGAGALLCLSALTQTYNEVEVTYGGSQKATLVIKFVDEQQTTKAATTKAETTKADEPGESETNETSTEEITTADYSQYEWVAVPNGSKLFYNSNNTAKEVINVQKPGFAEEEGVYITVSSGISDVTVNGQQAGFAKDGAGVVIYLSALTNQYNEVVIKHAEGTANVILKNDKNAPTDATTVAPSESQTSASEGIQMNQNLPGKEAHNDYKIGAYDIYVGGWGGSNAMAGVDLSNPNHVMIQQTSANWNSTNQDALQVKALVKGLTAGEEYTVSWLIQSANDDGNIKTNFTNGTILLTGQEQELAGSFTATSNEKELAILMGYVGTENPVEIKSLTVTDSQGRLVYPNDNEDATTAAETTTKAPTTTTKAPETTTKAPTTTKSSTVIPTVKPIQPTVALKDAAAVENSILSAKSDKDPDGSTFGPLRAQVKKSAKKTNKVVWKKVAGATKYVVYGGKCGKGIKKLKTTTGSKFTHKKLKKGKYYKYLVVAINAQGKVVAISKMIHSATKGGKNRNAKKLKLKKSKFTLAVGQNSAKIKAKQVKDGKKGKIKKHRKIYFESTNPSVATVSSAGVITGKAKGTCQVLVFAQNGVYKTVNVTVK